MLKNTMVILSLSVLVSGCYSTNGVQNTGTKAITPLKYHAGNDTLVLDKECIKEVSFSIYGSALFLDIEKNENCSDKLVSFFRNNVGEVVEVSFNDIIVTEKTKVVSPVKIENGFYQNVTQRTDAVNIINYYKK